MPKQTSPSKPEPSAIDIHVGERLRRLRSFRNMTQQALGESLGLSFQQVQKYEKGTNRISASKMFEIMQTFGVSADYFFKGLEPDAPQTGFAEPPAPDYDLDSPSRAKGGHGKDAHTEEAGTGEGLALLQAYRSIGNPVLRQQVLELVKTIAKDNEQPSE